MPASFAPVRWNSQRAGVSVFPDGIVVREDNDGLADRWVQARLASVVLLLAAVVVAGLRINVTAFFILLGLALLPMLVYGAFSLVAIVWGLGQLATKRGRSALRRESSSIGDFLDARTMHESLSALPAHIAAVPRTDIVGAELLSRRALVLHTRRGPQQIRARWWHPLVLGRLSADLSDPHGVLAP